MSDGSRKFGSDAAEHRPRLIDRLRSMVGIGGASVRDDIEDALADTKTETDFSPQERTMLKNVLGLHELRVEDVMVPRADIIAVQASASLAEVLSMFRTAGHSRLPVFNETLDDPRGMVHIRDFLDHLATVAEIGTRRRRRKIVDPQQPSVGGLDLSVPLVNAKILRPVLFVPPSMPALDLLIKMQATRTHMALVIDEYGGTDGLVSIEDIVETIVGDIEDEHDEDSEAVDTVGGLVTSLAGRVPVRGEIVAGEDGLEFEILDADPRRIKRLRISLRDLSLPAPALRKPSARSAAPVEPDTKSPPDKINAESSPKSE